MSAQPSKEITKDLAEVVVLLMGMRKHLLCRMGSNRENDEDVLLVTALERAGGLADRSISALGGTPAIGAPEEWRGSRARDNYKR